jgi:hypothetical protein
MRLDDYESVRPERRPQLELILSRQDREELLLEWGATFPQVIDAIRVNIRAKNQRRRTVNNIGTYDRWEEAVENAGRKIKRTLLLKKSTRQRVEEVPPQSQVNVVIVREGHDVKLEFAEKDPEYSPQLTSLSEASTDFPAIPEPEVLMTPQEPMALRGIQSDTSVDSQRPTSVVDFVKKTTISEDFYSYMEEMTVNSGLSVSASSHYTELGPQSVDNFEMLDRDSSFWEVDDGTDFPRIRRTAAPTVITEDVSFGALNHFDHWDNRKWSAPMETPPISNSIIDKWE